DIVRLTRDWCAIRGRTPESYQTIISSRIDALADTGNPFPVDEGINFIVYGISGFWHWESCGPLFEETCSEDGFPQVSGCIVDAISWLEAQSEMEDEGKKIDSGSTSSPIHIDDLMGSPYQQGVHFTFYQNKGEASIHWQGFCQEPGESRYWWNPNEDFAHLSSTRGYFNGRIATADCIFSLHIERGYNVEEAANLVCDLGLPVYTVIAENLPLTGKLRHLQVAELERLWNQISLPVQQGIEEAIQAVSEENREKARYGMILVTPLSKEQL
ncbi:MAG: hypothetical protein AAF329_18720, partial [Cyanobacteria bacterium P01_A01_bin.17]